MRLGHISRQFLGLLFLALASFLLVPVVAALPAALPSQQTPLVTAVVTSGNLNIRSAPSSDASVITVVSQGTTLTLTGRTADSAWAQVVTPNGQLGWANASFLQISTAISTLPIIDTNATATPTSTISPTATPTAGATAVPTTSASSSTATVSSGNLNVRSGPGVSFSVITTLSHGTAVTLIGRNVDSSWAKVRLANGTEGWVNASLIQANMAISSLAVVESPAAPVATSVPVSSGPGLNVRSGPGTSYSVLGKVINGQDITLLGRNSVSTWVKIQTVDGLQGWISASFVQAATPVSSLPIVDGTAVATAVPGDGATPVPVPSGAIATVNSGALNVRSGPGIGYNSIATTYSGTVLSLLGRIANNSWVKVRLSNGVEGWVNASLILPNVAISSLPVLDVPALTAVAPVITGAANVRSGPSLNNPSIAVVYNGTIVTLLGRNSDGSWLKVQLSNGQQGWMNIATIQPNVVVNTLTIMN